MNGLELLFSKEARKRFARGMTNKIISEQKKKTNIIIISLPNNPDVEKGKKK